MEQNIYLDVYFGFNFLMDFFVLLLTRIIIKNNKNVAHITLASSIGAIYATLVLLFEAKGILVMLVTYLLVAELMSLLAFGKANLKESIKRLGVLYCVTLTTNGLINSTYYGSQWGRSLFEKANTMTFGKLSIGLVLCIVIIVTTIVSAVADKIRKCMKISRSIYQVKIYEGGITICVKALCDTGNSLIEPITKKPVSVVEQECINGLKKEKMRQIFIPYNSVGKQHGLMSGFVAEKLEIKGKIISNPIIGIYEGKLSHNRRFEMILHPDIVDENYLEKN